MYSGWSDVVGSTKLRLCHTCFIDVMPRKMAFVLKQGSGIHENNFGSWIIQFNYLWLESLIKNENHDDYYVLLCLYFYSTLLMGHLETEYTFGFHLIFTEASFGLRVLSLLACVCVCVCISVSVCPSICPRNNWSTTWLRSLLFWCQSTLTFKVKFYVKVKFMGLWTKSD